MIEVKNLVKEFHTPEDTIKAIDGVSFHVKKGEVYGIIGLSGAGKSTVVRCLNFLEEPTSGEVCIDGEILNHLSYEELLKARQDIGMIFQQFNLFEQQTIYDNVAFPLEILGRSKEEINDRVLEMLDFVGLLERKNDYPSQLSGGQKQRVAIARALTTKPKILLSDESTSALDPDNTQEILNLLKESVEKYHMTIVMITHQMEVAKNICDRIAVMEDGKIIEENTVENIFRAPKTARTRSFIDSLPDYVEETISQEDFDGKLIRLNFSEETSKEPIVQEVMSSCPGQINIISGNLSTLGTGSTVGHLVVEIKGTEEEIENIGLQFSLKNILVEEI